MSKGGESLGPVPGVVALFLAGRASSKGRVVEGGGPEGEKEGHPSLSLFSLLALVVSKRGSRPLRVPWDG